MAAPVPPDLSLTRRYVTLTYTPSDGSSPFSITIREAEPGNGDTRDPNQVVQKTLGGYANPYNRGPKVRRLSLDWHQLNDKERGDLEDFFRSDRVDQMLRWFSLTRTMTNREALVPGALVGGVPIYPGNYYPGQRILMDSYVFPAVRCITPTLNFQEPGSDYLFDLSLQFEIIPGNPPSNTSPG